VPIEAFLAVPVFHPNVHPDNGFVCLWTRGSTGDTIVTALVRLQNVIGWRLHNASPDHLMQPAALAWAASATDLPLPCTPIEIPASLSSNSPGATPRRIPAAASPIPIEASTTARRCSKTL